MIYAPVMQVHTPRPLPMLYTRTYAHSFCPSRKTAAIMDAGPITVTIDRASGTVRQIVASEAARRCKFDAKTFRGLAPVKVR